MFFDFARYLRVQSKQLEHLPGLSKKLTRLTHGGGGGFFHSKGTWGCAACKGIFFRTSSLAKVVLFSKFSRVKYRQGCAFWQFWSKKCQHSVIFVKKNLTFLKFWSRKCENLVSFV